MWISARSVHVSWRNVYVIVPCYRASCQCFLIRRDMEGKKSCNPVTGKTLRVPGEIYDKKKCILIFHNEHKKYTSNNRNEYQKKKWASKVILRGARPGSPQLWRYILHCDVLTMNTIGRKVFKRITWKLEHVQPVIKKAYAYAYG